MSIIRVPKGFFRASSGVPKNLGLRWLSRDFVRVLKGLVEASFGLSSGFVWSLIRVHCVHWLFVGTSYVVFVRDFEALM